jgi:hypothetical protein
VTSRYLEESTEDEETQTRTSKDVNKKRKKHVVNANVEQILRPIESLMQESPNEHALSCLEIEVFLEHKRINKYNRNILDLLATSLH